VRAQSFDTNAPRDVTTGHLADPEIEQLVAIAQAFSAIVHAPPLRRPRQSLLIASSQSSLAASKQPREL